MSGLPKISVVTPTFNGIATLRETIESVLTQDYKNWEHIIIDGGSTDGTLDLVRTYPHLRWISEKDQGHYHAMNKGIQRASGEIVAILNADDCYREGALRTVAGAFIRNPEWDALFGDVVYVDGKSREIFRREEACYDYDVLRFSNICYVIHPTLFVKKDVYDRLGFYRDKEFLNAADGEFILRLGQAGCRVGHVKMLLANYRFHESGQSADSRVNRNTAREWRIICQAHGMPSGFRRMLFSIYYRSKRQAQKLIHRGTCDLVPGRWKLRSHTGKKTTFTSNIDFNKLKAD
jgi:glycosyltransferase involved in cell wall biosynthesis